MINLLIDIINRILNKTTKKIDYYQLRNEFIVAMKLIQLGLVDI